MFQSFADLSRNFDVQIFKINVLRLASLTRQKTAFFGIGAIGKKIHVFAFW